MTSAQILSATVGTVAACDALDLARASFYRALKPQLPALAIRPTPARSLSPGERETVLATLNSDRFVDASPREAYATLLDEGSYLCSVSTIYRILDSAQQVRERRNQLRHPNYKKPELLATAPNQVWSWDITKLLGPAKWTYFYLYGAT